MPRASTRSSTAATNPSNGFILKAAPGSKRRVIVPRPKTYEDAISAAAKYFPSIPKAEINLQSDELDVPGELVDISPEFWGQAMTTLDSIFVVRDAVPPKCESTSARASLNIKAIVPAQSSSLESTSTPSQPKRIISLILSYNGPRFNFLVKDSSSILKITQAFAERVQKDATDLHLIYLWTPISPAATVGDINWIPGHNIIYVLPKQTGGKPVIYLMSPTELDATVNLSLAPSWTLSAIYPVVPVKTKILGGQNITWDVCIHRGGSLTDKNTGLDVAYIYWEAKTVPDTPLSPPSSPLPGQHAFVERFCPNTSDLYDNNSVVLPVPLLTPYLDKALKALGLHTEARTSFITYWLPSLLKHTHVALRFVPQTAYECAAPLNVSPAPDVVTRVFMLFKGVPSENLELWPEAQARVTNNVEMWAEVVGVDVEKASDTGLFRVLEWGGMEVLRG